MITNDRKYNTAEKTAYDGAEALDREMDSARNAYKQEDLFVNNSEKGRVTRNSTAGFEKLLNAPVENTDIYPSETTMQFNEKDRKYLYEDFHAEKEEEKAEENSEYRVNTKGKILITVYALVVLTIFTLIILNTRLLKNMNDSLSQQEARVAAMIERTEELKARYEFVSSDAEVIRRAEEMGMVKAD